MTYPICDMCASSGVLCNGCQKKLDDGRISDLDVAVSRFLAHQDISGYERLKEAENGVFLFAERALVPKIIGYSGKTVKELSKRLGKRVIVIEDDASLNEMIDAVVRPSKAVALNTVYKGDGSESLKVVLSQPMREPGDIALLEALIGMSIAVE